MTASEIKKTYGISEDVLNTYEIQVKEKISDIKTGEDGYSDQELEKISMVITLQEIGFHEQEIGEFFRLAEKGTITKDARRRMLLKQRNRILDEIHRKEKILEELDYIRYGLEGTGSAL